MKYILSMYDGAGRKKMKYVQIIKENRVAVVSINHEPANALSSNVLKDISTMLDHILEDNEIRAVILHGEGRFFSAGADIKEFVELAKSDGVFSQLAESGQQLFERIENFPIPIIAAIHGAALGGGLELAMSCHLRLVAEDAKLGLPELQLGIIPGFGGTQRLPKYIGTGRALEMMLTSEPISGQEAVKLGLASHAYPQEKLLAEAKGLAQKFAAKSPGSVRAVISLLHSHKTLTYQEGMNLEAKLFGELFKSGDAREGISAFIEKRKPNFKGN